MAVTAWYCMENVRVKAKRMRRQFEQVKAVLLILILVTAILTVGCGDRTKSDPPTITPSAEDNKGASITPTDKDDDTRDTYVAAKGAASEYELYTTMVAFLNNGFHYADLNDVYDLTMASVFYTKWQSQYGYNFTQGMSCEEAYKLFTELKKIASQMEAPTNDAEAAQLDFDAFKAAFPADRQQQINEHLNSFKTLIVGYFFRLEVEYQAQEGISPFRTPQTTWTVVPAEEYSAMQVNASELSEDVVSSFPAIKAYDFDGFADGNASYRSGYYYTEINGRYYLLGFYSEGKDSAR